MRALQAMAVLACSSLLTGCGVYLHDASLVAPATIADTRVQAATPLKPFDDQLQILEAFAPQPPVEELAGYDDLAE